MFRVNPRFSLYEVACKEHSEPARLAARDADPGWIDGGTSRSMATPANGSAPTITFPQPTLWPPSVMSGSQGINTFNIY